MSKRHEKARTATPRNAALWIRCDEHCLDLGDVVLRQAGEGSIKDDGDTISTIKI